MDKETKSIVFILITMLLNVIAPILLINTIRDYTKSSKVYGSPSIYEVSDYISSSNYIFQENLSTISYTAETSGTNIKYTYNYYFESINLDTTQNNYSLFVNDYICTTDSLDARSISSTHLHDFYDIDKNLINSVELTIEFKSYTTYTTLLITIIAQDNDLSYWNSYCSNPGFVLTLSKVNYGMLGNLETYKEVTTLQEQLAELQKKYDELQSIYSSLQGQYDNATLTNTELNKQINELQTEIADLQARLDAYDKQNKYEVTFQSNDITQKVSLVENGSNLVSSQIPTLEHTLSSHFSGWSLDGTTIIDPTTVNINQNTTFKAVWKNIEGSWTISSVDNTFIFEADKNIVIDGKKLSEIADIKKSKMYDYILVKINSESSLIEDSN